MGTFFYGISFTVPSYKKLKNESMKKFMFIGWLFVSNAIFCQNAPGEIVGTIINSENAETIFGAQVFVIDQDRKYQAISDEDGRFRITAIPAGEYTMQIKYHGDTMNNIAVNVPMDGIYQSGTIKFNASKMLGVINVKADDGRMKLEYGSLPVRTITAEEIQQSSAKFSVASLATTMSSEIRMADDGQLMFRGARKGDMIYLMDGIKSSEISNVPSCSIARMMVYTGGLPAKYGDTLGGAIVVETLSYFDLYRAWEREELKKN